MPSYCVVAQLVEAMRDARVVSQNQAQGDSRSRLVIGVARHRPDLFSVALGHAPVPAGGQWIEGVHSRVPQTSRDHRPGRP
jgi:hypothetical protein